MIILTLKGGQMSFKIMSRIAVLSVLALLLITAAVYAQNTTYRGDRLTTVGTINSISREGDAYRITLDHGYYSYLVPSSMVGARDLRVGESVRLSGPISGNLVNADVIALQGEPYYMNDPYYRPVPFGSTGWLSGTVLSTNRHLGYLTIRDDQTGATEHIDVRHMDRSRPVNVWGIRDGDHISVLGSWEQRSRFDAQRIEY
jgi:hypothetical protein